MSSVEPPSGATAPPEPPTPSESAPSGKQRPTLWIVLTGLFAAAAIGLGIWAGTLQADINDKDDQIAALQQTVSENQREATAADEEAAAKIAALEQQVADLEATVANQQQAAEGSAAETEQALKEAQAQVDAANEELGATSETLATTQAELDQLKKTSDAAIADAEAAAAEAQGAAADAEARAAAAEAKAAAEKARADLAEGCLQAVADILGRIYDVEDATQLPDALRQASQELAEIAPTCAPPTAEPA